MRRGLPRQQVACWRRDSGPPQSGERRYYYTTTRLLSVNIYFIPPDKLCRRVSEGMLTGQTGGGNVIYRLYYIYIYRRWHWFCIQWRVKKKHSLSAFTAVTLFEMFSTCTRSAVWVGIYTYILRTVSPTFPCD